MSLLLTDQETEYENANQYQSYRSYQSLDNIGYPEFHFDTCNLKLSRKELDKLQHIENVINYTLRYKTESELNDINKSWMYRKYLSSNGSIRNTNTKPIEVSINLSLPYDYMLDYKLSYKMTSILNYAGIEYFTRSYMCGLCNYTIIKFDRLLKTRIENYIKTKLSSR
jgi:hypothetical protein